MFVMFLGAYMKKHPKMDQQEVGDIIAYGVKSATRQRVGEGGEVEKGQVCIGRVKIFLSTFMKLFSVTHILVSSVMMYSGNYI